MATGQINIGQTISDEELQALSAPEVGQAISDEEMQALSMQSVEVGQSLTDEQLEDLMNPQEKSSSWLKEMGKDILKGSTRGAGIALGVLNSPLAFIWGSQAEQYRDPDQWKKLPFWKKQLVSTGAGFESAYRAIFKEGDLVSLYGE